MDINDFEKLQEAYTIRGIELHQLHERVSSLEEENARLKELLKLQQQNQFGKKNESSNNLDLSGASSADVTQPTALTPVSSTVVQSHVRAMSTRGPRQLDTNGLPRYRIVHDLPEDEKTCSCCGGSLHEVGRETSEKLEIIPVQYCIVEHVRITYGCRPCDSIKMSPKTPDPVPKAIAGASLLTDVVLKKYQYHQPLYRQSKIMKSYSITVSDKTLANWVIKSGDALMQVYDAMWVILTTRYLQIDETPVKVLETNKKGYIWVYFSPNVGKGLVAFEFSLTRKSFVAEDRLKTFKGLMQTDGYKGYEKLRNREGIVGFGCLSHARRKFAEVVKISGDRHGIAAELIERLKPLYALEERLRQANADHRTRKRLRQKIARPILKAIYKWIRSIKGKVMPKSKLGGAITYLCNQWPYLVAYLNHGMAEIDTNYVENIIRNIGLGRKNWLFIGNEDCGKIHALWYTLIISAVINDINPRVYIHYLLTKAHQLRRGEIDPVSLLPDRIDITELESFAKEQIEFGKLMLGEFDTS